MLAMDRLALLEKEPRVCVARGLPVQLHEQTMLHFGQGGLERAGKEACTEGRCQRCCHLEVLALFTRRVIL